MPDKFRYDALFAANAPEVPPGKTRHARYDFAVAYPNPDTLPLDGLADAVRYRAVARGPRPGLLHRPRRLPRTAAAGGGTPGPQPQYDRRPRRRLSIDRRLRRGHLYGDSSPHRPRRHGSNRGISVSWHAALPPPLPRPSGGRPMRRGRHHPRSSGRHHNAAESRGPPRKISLHHPHLPKPAGLDYDIGAAPASAGNHAAA